jgi:hypothetical protein
MSCLEDLADLIPATEGISKNKINEQKIRTELCNIPKRLTL